MSDSMRVLITGGAGFVGANLALALRGVFPDAEIVCMDNLYRRGSELNLPRLREHNVAFSWGDVRDERSFPRGPFDFLLDCSAEPSVLAGQSGGPDFLLQTNLVGACHCLEKARLWGSRLLFLSSSRVYPIERLERHPWREEATRFAWADEGTAGISSLGVQERLDMSGARSLYGYTKYAAELLVEEYRAAWGLKAVVDRCGIIAGPWQFGKADQGVASLWVLAHYFGRPLSYIGYGGQGKQVRDFLHIDDLCELLAEQVKEFNRWEGWLGNVAGGLANSASLCELTALCQEITGRRVAVQSVDANRPWDLRLFLGDCRRLFERTAWRPRRGVRQLVSDLAQWVAQNEPPLRNL
jgi:CDP-paratose 2-epimerase